MTQYMFLIYGNEAAEAEAGPEEWAMMLKAHREWQDQVGEGGGTVVDGNALTPTSTATSVRVQTDSTAVTDGPFAETKEALGGYYLVDVENLDQAIAMAKMLPTSGGVEIRPVMDTSGG